MHWHPETEIESVAALDLLGAIPWDHLSVEEIEALLPSLGMNDEIIHEMPTELGPHFGRGLRFWQYPNQFSRLLDFLRNRRAESYLEIGCRWGGTFVIIDSLLRHQNPALRSVALDLIEQPPLLKLYANRASITYLQGDSQGRSTWRQLPAQVDIVFIDGLHTWDGVRNDFNNALRLHPHTIILHDTCNQACPEVVAFWQALTRVFSNTVEFHQQYDSVPGTYLGTGVVCLEAMWPQTPLAAPSRSA